MLLVGEDSRRWLEMSVVAPKNSTALRTRLALSSG